MKKILSFLLVTALLLSCTAVFAAAEEAETYTFGIGEGETLTEQGTDGWYYVYSEEYGKYSGFDTSKFQECELGNNTDFAAWGGDYWAPVDYAEEFKDAGKWFLIDGSGRVEGAGGRTAAVKWVAPADGAYVLKASVDAGVSDTFFQYITDYGITWDESIDGVACMIFKNDEVLTEHRTGETWSWWDWPIGSNENWWEGYYVIDGSNTENHAAIKHQKAELGEWTVSLKKGDALYFVTDNKGGYTEAADDGFDYDYADWDIEITKAGEAIYGFGIGGETPYEQGVDGWYFMYSKDINKGDKFDLDSLKECAYPGATSAIMAWGGDYWTPDIDDSELSKFIVEDDPATEESEWKNSFWWMIDAESGQVTPDGNLTAAVKWVVPVSGKYNMAAAISGGYSSSYEQWGLPYDVPNDGVYGSVYYNGEKIFSKDFTGKQAEEVVLDEEMDLKKGDVFYFILDPKELAGEGYDVGGVSVAALLLEAAKEPTPTTTTTTTTTTATTTTTTTAKPQTSPDTGADSVLPVALVLMGAAAFTVVLSKKKASN